MGTYDYLVDGPKIYQVKLWESEFNSYNVGNNVPPRKDLRDYGIVLREGAVAIIKDLRLEKIVPLHNPVDSASYPFPLFDKYGEIWDYDVYIQDYFFDKIQDLK